MCIAAAGVVIAGAAGAYFAPDLIGSKESALIRWIFGGIHQITTYILVLAAKLFDNFLAFSLSPAIFKEDFIEVA